MLDYGAWPSKRLSVTSLLLDTQNPRLPQSGGALTQRQMIEELVTHDTVYDLAKDIATQGFFPTEVLLGVKDGDHVLVVEGNRRLAALKLLINPELAPQAYLDRFRRLSETIPPKTIEKVQVTMAPSRQAATPILLSRHIGLSVQGWSRPMQARFYRQLLQNGVTPDTLIQQYGVPPAELQKYVQADAVYRLACSLDFPETVKARVQDTRGFPLSTLERLVTSEPVREFLQLKPDPDKLLVSTAKSDEFLKAFRQIVEDVATGKVDSRKANDEEGIKQYLVGLVPMKPATRGRGKFSLRDHLSQTEKPTPPINTQPKRRPNGAKSPSILPKSLKNFCPDPRVEAIHGELRRLHLEKHPNASAVLLRLLLEFSLSYYLDVTEQIQPILDRARAKDKKPASWYPPLRHLMTHVLVLDIGLKPLEIKALKKFTDTKDQGGTLDALDGFVHNRNVEPIESELRAIVRLIEPLLKVTLGRVEPPSP